MQVYSKKKKKKREAGLKIQSEMYYYCFSKNLNNCFLKIDTFFD